jgi:flagellar biogenesis protein FliO
MPLMGHRAGLAAWLIEKLRGAGRERPRLALLERIALAPRHSLALVEAEGRRFLVATSAEGAPVFYALDAQAHSAGSRNSAASAGHARVSW